MPRRSLWVQIGYHMAILSSHPNKHVLNGPDPSTLSPLSWPLNHGCSKNFLTARMLARVRIGLYPISSEKFLICKEPKSVKNPIFLVVKQREISSIANSIVEEAVVGILCTNFPESLGFADLGCSSGPNTFIISSKIIDIVHATSCRLGRPVPELRVSLNDLPGNDFNCIFKALPEFYKKLKEEKGGGFDRCYVSGVPGSFYGRLFPSKSLHFVHSSFSLHWLSQVPPDLDSKEGIPLNKGKLHLSKTSPPRVLEAYLSQFQKDFPLFLKSRAEEMVAGGRMVLTFQGRKDIDTAVEHWDHLALALMSLASEGLVEEEKIDSFNFPYYTPCPKEVKLVVQTDGSFVIDRLETFEYYWDDQMKTEFEELSSGQRIAKTIRAVVESMIECHFGREIMDVLFRRYGEIMDDHLSRNRAKTVVLVVSLIRMG